MAQILVVDDDRWFLETLCANLETSGHVCESASSVGEALTLLGTRHIDLVLTDYDMPRESGLTLIENMKNRPWLEPIPVILVTGNPDHGLLALAKRIGVFTTIPKPFDLDFLLQAVAQALGSLPGEEIQEPDQE